jgi:hypothetical protein
VVFATSQWRVETDSTCPGDLGAILTYSEILRFYLPLVITSQMMTLSVPLINLGLGRTADPVLALAGYAVGFSVSVVCNAPVLTARAVTAGLVRSAASYRVVARVMRWLGLILSGVALGLALLPAGDWLFLEVLGAPESIARQARLVLLLQSPIPVLLAERGLAQGLVLIYRRTLLISLATLMRLAMVTMMVLMLALLLHLPGAAAGGLSLTAGVGVEALVIRLAVRRRFGPFREPLPGAMVPAAVVTPGRVVGFALPLAINNMVWSLQRALINAIIARLSDPVTALAGFGVVVPIFMFFGSPLFGIQATVQVLPHSRRDMLKLARFTLAMAAGLSLVASTSMWLAGRTVLAAGYGLAGGPLAAGLPALNWIWIHPLLVGFRSYGQGMLLRAGRTGPIAMGAMGRVAVVTAVGLTLVGWFPEGNGAVIGVSLQILGDGWDMALAGTWGLAIMRRTFPREKGTGSQHQA